jgi:hypothetical protein
MVGDVILISNETEKSVKVDNIDLNSLESISVFCYEVECLLEKINQLYFEKYEEYLWENLSKLRNGLEIYGGSSKYLFDTDIPKLELLKHKSVFGDIDILVDRKKLKNLFHLLPKLENTEFSNVSIYLGQTKSEFYGFKISTIW